MKINSGYRSWARNVEVYRNGKNPTKSRHCSGKAADIEIAGLTGMQIAKLAVDSCGDGIGDTSADIRGRWAKGTSPWPAPVLSSGPAVLKVQQAQIDLGPSSTPPLRRRNIRAPRPERPSRTSRTTGKSNPATRPGTTTA